MAQLFERATKMCAKIPLFGKGVNLVEYDIRKARIGADGAAVKKLTAAQMIWVVSKNLTLAGSRADILGDTQ